MAASFDSVDHEWLLRMVAHRIADPRILRLIELWLRTGVLESGETSFCTTSSISGPPWRSRHARGRVVTVRYADDFVMGFESKADAQEMLLAPRCGWPALA